MSILNADEKKRLAELEAEVEQYIHHNERLNLELIAAKEKIEELEGQCERLDKLADGRFEESTKDFIQSVRSEGNGATAVLRSVFVKPLVSMLLEWFDLEGGVNYVGFSVQDKKRGEFNVIVQRLDGETPAQQIDKLKAALAASEALSEQRRLKLVQYQNRGGGYGCVECGMWARDLKSAAELLQTKCHPKCEYARLARKAE